MGEDESLAFETIVAKLAPSANFDAAAKEAFDELRLRVTNVFGEEAGVMLFGSLVQGVHLDGSDLDVALNIPSEEAEDGDVDENGQSAAKKPDNSRQVHHLTKIMTHGLKGMRVIETRFFKHIKVPILIVGVKTSSGFEVEADISQGVEFGGVEKNFTDRLVRRVLATSQRALHLVRLVKLWAKVEGINKAYDGFLNALGWTVLVLYYFLEQGEFSTDVLHQEEVNELGTDGDGSLPPQLHAVGEGEEADLSMVPSSLDVAGFFDWLLDTAESWPENPPGGAWGLSLVDGMLIDVPPPSTSFADQVDFYIEDPGVKIIKGTSENIARTLKASTWSSILDSCRNASSALRGDGRTTPEGWVKSLIERHANPNKRPLPGGQLLPGGESPAKKMRMEMAEAMNWLGAWHATQEAKSPANGSNFSPRAAGKTQKCVWFAKGECWDGDKCKRLHEL